MSRLCILKCFLNKNPPISLPHNVTVVIGRNPLTNIRDDRCSREQISLKANYDKCTVEVKQVGMNTSGLEGFSMVKDKTYEVGHASQIELLINKYIYIIEFDPPPENSSKTVSSKRKAEDDDCIGNEKTKIIKMESPKSELTETLENTWDYVDGGELYVFTSKGVKARNKIAAFDMDGTLIKTKSGKVHPVNIYDWEIAFPTIVKKFKEKVNEGFKIVILTNQAPIGNGRVKMEDFKKKILSIVEKIQVPVQIFIATGKGIYRKPAIGMWKILIEQKNDNLVVDKSVSFYCGDAVGRLANWAPGKKKDHSMADKLLAENLGLTFYTPEQFFLGHSIKNIPIGKPEFNPRDISSEPFNTNLIGKEKEILVLVGYPGSGKSFLAKQIENKSNNQYVTVCRDKLGTWQKCASETTKYLQRGKSVIVDSTNPDKESRARWTSLASESKVSCRCIVMTTTFAHARHNNKFRELMKLDHLPVNDMIFYTYKKKFTEPNTEEGFKEVINVGFNPQFVDNEAETLYRMHLLEK